jgi:hypothetical protein
MCFYVVCFLGFFYDVCFLGCVFFRMCVLGCVFFRMCVLGCVFFGMCFLFYLIHFVGSYIVISVPYVLVLR